MLPATKWNKIPKESKINISILFNIVQTEEIYLFHGICEVDDINAFGLAKQYEKNFYNRIKSLFKWFEHDMSENGSHILPQKGFY